MPPWVAAAYSINDKGLKVSIIPELNEAQKKLTDREQYKIKQDEYDRQKDGIAQSTVNALGYNAGVGYSIEYKKSKYLGGEETGAGGQQRKYDRSDVFKDFTEEIKPTQLLGKELDILRDKQIALCRRG